MHRRDRTDPPYFFGIMSSVSDCAGNIAFLVAASPELLTVVPTCEATLGAHCLVGDGAEVADDEVIDRS